MMDVRRLGKQAPTTLHCYICRQRVLDAITELSLDTFFGPLAFNKKRQNYLGQPRLLQV
jgi:hypothetical protein